MAMTISEKKALVEKEDRAEQFYIAVRKITPKLTDKRLADALRICATIRYNRRKEDTENTLYAIWLSLIKWEQNTLKKDGSWNLGSYSNDCPLCIYYHRNAVRPPTKRTCKTICGLNCDMKGSPWWWAVTPARCYSKYQLIAALERKLRDACLAYGGDTEKFLARIKAV